MGWWWLSLGTERREHERRCRHPPPLLPPPRWHLTRASLLLQGEPLLLQVALHLAAFFL